MIQQLRNTLFIILLAVLWMPAFQMAFNFIESFGLKGAFAPHVKPELNDSTWFSGEYQVQYEKYLNDTIGFHQDFIRLRNQIDYSLFSKCHSSDIEVGKDEYLIATTHLDAHLGKVRISETKIDSTVKMLSQLNDYFVSKGITFMIIFAPSRGAYYLDKAPSWYDTSKRNPSDYDTYLKLLKKTSVKVLDFNQAFLEKKKQTKYPLYTKCGIHWSIYGASIAGDSIVKFIEKSRNIDLTDLTFYPPKKSIVANSTDADLNDALNLIWPVKNDTMAYPIIDYNTEKKETINALFIGDSYFFSFGVFNLPLKVFKECEFWYYFSTIYSNNQNNNKNTSMIELNDEILKQNVIAIMATETNLNNLGWGFVQKAWDIFCRPDRKDINYYINKIKNDTVWLEQVKKKAVANNKSLNQQLYEDAAWTKDYEAHK